MVVAAAVEEGPGNTPPPAASIGSAYIVGSAPTGNWAGRASCLAAFTEAGWRFAKPVAGLQAWVKSASTWAVFDGAAWETGSVRARRVMIDGIQVVGTQSAAVPTPAGGATVDAEARSAIASLLAALRAHGLIATE